MKSINVARVVVGVLGAVMALPAGAAVFVATNPFPAAPGAGIYRFDDDGSHGQLIGHSGGENTAGLAVDPSTLGGTLFEASNGVGLGALSTINATSGQRDVFFRAHLPAGVSYTLPGGIAVGAGGVLYATTGAFGQNNVNGLLKFDRTTGNYLGTLINLGTTGNFFVVSDVAVGADGKPYASAGTFGIVRASDASAAGETFISTGTGGLSGPMGLAFGPDGNLYVGSGNTKNILRYNGNTGAFIDTFVPAGAGGMGLPWDLAFASNGDLLVATGTDSVLRFGSTGAFNGVFATIPGTQIYTLTTGVPEPSAAGLAAVAFGAVATRRRGRQSALRARRLAVAEFAWRMTSAPPPQDA